MRSTQALSSLILMLAFFSSGFAHGQEVCCDTIPTNDCHDCLCCRTTLLGDCQARKCLGQHGMMLQSSLTQFYQGVSSGGANENFEYGGKFDLFLLADTARMGLWSGGKLQVPYLIDTGNGHEMYESDDIISYLHETFTPDP